jgi:hypothetical protein
MGRLFTAGASALIALVIGPPAVAALTVGDLLEAEYQYPTLGADYSGPDTLEYTGPGQVVNITATATNVDVTLFDSVVVFTDPGCVFACYVTDSAFNGPVLYDLSNPSAFVDWGVQVNTLSGVALVTPGEVGVNLSDLAPSAGEETAIGALPEPGAWIMLLLGVGAVGGAMRLSRTRALARATAA